MFKSIKFSFLAILFLAMFASCGKDDTTGNGSLEVTYKLLYQGQPLSMFTHYAYPNGDSLFFSRFSFYMSNLELKNGTSTQTLEAIKYHNLTNSHADKAKALIGYKVTYTGIPEGSYSQLNFGMGVSPTDNAKTPDEFPSSNDLSNQAEYWAGWNSYIFARTEGNIDFAKNGGYDTGMSLHLGGDVAFQNINLSKNIAITKDGTAKATVYIDIYKEFMFDNVMYDLKSDPQTHALSQKPQVIQLSQNLGKAFSIE